MRRLTWPLMLSIVIAADATAAVTETPVISLPMRGVLSLTLAPTGIAGRGTSGPAAGAQQPDPPGKADVERLSTISRIRIDIQRIAPPDRLGSAMNTYVAWAISPEGRAENVGELSLADGKARLETVTRLDRFGLLITAEPHYLVDLPGASVAYIARAPATNSTRHVAVETGKRSYADLKLAPAKAGTMTVVTQARAALEIARSAGAERLAENEFRLARVAIETMEAMLARSNPPDVVIPAAHDAIRHSARAAAVARDFAAGRDSGFNFGDDLFDKATGILNAAGRDAVQRMASAIPLWNGPLRIQCSAAAVPIARNALIQAGIPEDRLVFITAP